MKTYYNTIDLVNYSGMVQLLTELKLPPKEGLKFFELNRCELYNSRTDWLGGLYIAKVDAYNGLNTECGDWMHKVLKLAEKGYDKGADSYTG